MNKEEICNNCKHHYIEEITFDYPQSCCSKNSCTTERWLNCNDFEYSVEYVKKLHKEKQELIDYLKENINQCNRDIEIFGKNYNVYFSQIESLKVTKKTYEEILSKIEKE